VMQERLNHVFMTVKEETILRPELPTTNK